MMKKEQIINASYCVARKGKIFMHGAVGPVSYKENETRAYKPTDLQYIASVTKIFATVAFMKLVEDGLVRLDTPVGEILPPFNTPPYNGITPYHLLTHTSGLYPDSGCVENKHHVSYWELVGNYIKNYKEEDGEFDWLSAALGCHPRKGIGEEWQYCSFGFPIIGAMIEKLTGKHSHDYIMDEIVKPLGMTNTCFDISPEMAKNYVIQGERTEKYLDNIINGKKDPEHNPLWENIPSLGGGMTSNASDLIKFGTMLLNDGVLNGTRIIGRKAIEKVTTRALYNVPDHCWGANNKDRSYGIGFDMREGTAFTYSKGTFFHEGSGACALVMDPAEDLVAAWFVPFRGDGWHAEGLANTINIIWSGLQ
jgi:CubicO group peptidase (beta-lactamase class C family)